MALRVLRNTIEIQNTLTNGRKDCLLWSDDWLDKPDVLRAVKEVQVPFFPVPASLPPTHFFASSPAPWHLS